MSQKIVGNFVVGTVYSCDEMGQWTGTWLVRRYGVNNGRIIIIGTFTAPCCGFPTARRRRR